MNIRAVRKLFMDVFRGKRMKKFAKSFLVSNDTKIIDVGGRPSIWGYIAEEPQVTMVSIVGKDVAQQAFSDDQWGWKAASLW